MRDEHPRSSADKLSCIRDSLLRHLSDGQFTEHELQLVRAERDALGLSPQAVRTLRSEIYHAAYLRASQRGQISLAQADSLNRLLQFFYDSCPAERKVH